MSTIPSVAALAMRVFSRRSLITALPAKVTFIMTEVSGSFSVTVHVCVTLSTVAGFNLSFPCVSPAVNGSAQFQLFFEIDAEPNQRIVLKGTKNCDCSDSCLTNGGNSDSNLPFYIVIGCVGGLIAVVILVVVLYHCIMCRTLVAQRRSDLEEE